MTSGVLLQLPAVRKKLCYESSLRVAAATLKRALAGEVTATRVVGTIETSEHADRLGLAVRQVATEFDLEAQLTLNGTGFVVRFSLPD